MSAVKNPPTADKKVQRAYYSEKRKILMKNNERKAALDKEIQSRLILSAEYRRCKSVLLYSALENEIATSMIMYAALSNGKTVAYPRCEGEGIMRFFCVGSLSELVPGSYGILEPREGAEPFEPDGGSLCVCPAMSCDMQGYRLGYGGGYYDRFLSGFCGVSAALCYTDAVVPSLPREDFDIPVGMIVTDSYVRRIIK